MGLFGAMALGLLAQEPPAPPNVLRIIREDIKEGKEAAHQRTESEFMRAAAAAKYPADIIGMTSMTGTSQAWFLEGHDSFEAIMKTIAAFEKPELSSIDALDSEYRTSSRSWIAVYRPELSFHASELVQTLPKMRFVNVITIRVRPEHDQDFAELGRMAVAASERSMNDQPVVTYQIVSGAPNGTYLLLEPSASMKSLDAGPERSRALFQAMGDSGTKRFMKTASETIAQSEAILFALAPQMSYVPKTFAAQDPVFWTPKPVVVETPENPPDKPAPAKTSKKTTAKK
jgi:hypothetical protein